MNFTTNLVLALCCTFNPGATGYSVNEKLPEYHASGETVVKQSTWELIKSRNGISVFSQWITLHDGFKTRRLRGDFQVVMPMQELIAVLKDGNKIKNWMEGVSESHTIKNQDDNCYSYAKFNIPWPFSDQDLVVENILDYNGQSDTAYIFLESRPDLVPEDPALNRMRNFYGYWKLVRVAPGVTHVEYAAYSRSEPIVPRFIQDPIIVNTFLSSLDNLASYCGAAKN